MKNPVSLGELSMELKVNKSRLAYYFQAGLLHPIATVGKMNVFDRKGTIDTIKKIDELQKKGKTLQEIKEMI